MIRILISVALLVDMLLLPAQEDPHVYLENMYRKVTSTGDYHVKVNVSVRGNDGRKSCSTDAYEVYRRGDRSLTIKPERSVLSSDDIFILVDRTIHTITVNPRATEKASTATHSPDPLLGINKLRDQWRKATVLQENARSIRYRYSPMDGSYRSIEIVIDKKSSLFTDIIYEMTSSEGDDCSVIVLRYDLLDLKGDFPDSVFDPGRFTRFSNDAWTPSKEYAGYDIHLIEG